MLKCSGMFSSFFIVEIIDLFVNGYVMFATENAVGTVGFRACHNQETQA